GKRAATHEKVGHGHLLGARHGVLELLAQADRKVDAGRDRDLKRGYGRLRLGHATGDRRLHPRGLDHLGVRTSSTRGRRLLATPVGGGARCAGRHHVLFDDAAFGSASFQRRKVDSHLGGQALGQGRGLDPAIVLTILSSLLPRGWRRRRRALTRGRGLLRGLLLFCHRRRGLGFFRLGLSLLLGRRGWFGRWSFLHLLATFTDLGDRCPDLGRHALLDQDLQHPVGLRL